MLHRGLARVSVHRVDICCGINRMLLVRNRNLYAAAVFISTARAFSVQPPNKTTMSTLQEAVKLDNSWIRQLSPETPENLKKSRQEEGLPDDDDNRKRRPVFNGHYVMVKPTGLKDPRLILYSKDVAQRLKLNQDIIKSDQFLQYVSGNLILNHESWATPYALSIVGTRYTSNCPYGTGNGYGDGRAVSIGEFQNMELQLKGAGQTPFCRRADGRAVLRSSIREFLASEAMWNLGVRTTRALSLVVSGQDKSYRPWYSESFKLKIPAIDDPRLAQYSDQQKAQIISQLRNEKADPNMMIEEPCAITCRVCTSFVRVGHLDLFARRAEKQSRENAKTNKSRYDTTTLAWKELEQLVWHACYREFRTEAYDPFIASADIAAAATVLLQKSAERLSEMAANWIRVGFAQGNFNGDNCLVGGHTMDYGPFGFMDEYNPLFAKWTGSGQHFGFMNQPSAALANFQVLAESVVPVICAAKGLQDPTDTLEKILEDAQETFQLAFDKVLRKKMGFSDDSIEADDLWTSLETLLRNNRVDWTLFWRQLTMVAAEYDDYTFDDYEAMLEVLISEGNKSPFYEPLSAESQSHFLEFIKRWRQMLQGEQDVAERMRMANPKYVLREWMLVKAYSNAGNGNEELLNDLYELIQRPYEEGTPEEEELYYRRTPDEALMAGGTAFMS